MNFKDSVPRRFLDGENRESNFENLTPPMDSSTPIPFGRPLWISRIRSPDASLMEKIENPILKIWHHHSILRYWFRIENFCGRLRNFFDSDVLLTSTNKPTHTQTFFSLDPPYSRGNIRRHCFSFSRKAKCKNRTNSVVVLVAIVRICLKKWNGNKLENWIPFQL